MVGGLGLGRGNGQLLTLIRKMGVLNDSIHLEILKYLCVV